MRIEIDLDAAARAGLIDESMAIALRNFQAKLDKVPTVTAEKFQLFGGYADIITALGAGMVLMALCMLAAELKLYVAALPMTVAIWFAAKRVNMRNSPATATILMISFLFSSFWVLPSLMHLVGMEESRRGLPFFIFILAICLPALASCWMYWRKFRFPPTPAALVAGGTLLLLQIIIPHGREALPDYFASVLALTIATGSLVAGTWWDMTDIRRETERSQVAFWLHCCAGFLMTRAIFSLFTGHDIIEGELIATGLQLAHFPYVMAMITVGALISLLLDRRSLLVGVLLPTAGMFKALNDGQSNFGYIDYSTITGLAVAGVGLLFFSWGWLGMRRSLLAIIPAKLAAQLPRTEVTSHGQRPTRRNFEHWRTIPDKNSNLR